jgi:hypothetical protein
LATAIGGSSEYWITRRVFVAGGAVLVVTVIWLPPGTVAVNVVCAGSSTTVYVKSTAKALLFSTTQARVVEGSTVQVAVTSRTWKLGGAVTWAAGAATPRPGVATSATTRAAAATSHATCSAFTRRASSLSFGTVNPATWARYGHSRAGRE